MTLEFFWYVVTYGAHVYSSKTSYAIFYRYKNTYSVLNNDVFNRSSVPANSSVFELAHLISFLGGLGGLV